MKTDDAPPATESGPRYSRRRVLVGIAALLSGSSLRGLARAGPAQAPGTAGTVQRHADFLRLSQAITGHVDLDATTADRIEAAMLKADSTFGKKTKVLAGLAAGSADPTALLAAARAAGVGDTALEIVAAWYTGTIGKGKTAVLVAYREALMYRPVSDAQEIPTYCTHGEQWWLHAPPALGIPRLQPTAPSASGPKAAAPAPGAGKAGA